MGKDNVKFPGIHPLVKAMEEKGESIVELKGFLGTTEKKGVIRVYEDLDTSSFFEVPKVAVLHLEKKEEEAPGKVRLFVKAMQKIEHIKIRPAFEIETEKFTVPLLIHPFFRCAQECITTFKAHAAQIQIDEVKNLDDGGKPVVNRGGRNQAKQVFLICLEECLRKTGFPTGMIIIDELGIAHWEPFNVLKYHSNIADKVLPEVLSS